MQTSAQLEDNNHATRLVLLKALNPGDDGMLSSPSWAQFLRCAWL